MEWKKWNHGKGMECIRKDSTYILEMIEGYYIYILEKIIVTKSKR